MTVMFLSETIGRTPRRLIGSLTADELLNPPRVARKMLRCIYLTQWT